MLCYTINLHLLVTSALTWDPSRSYTHLQIRQISILAWKCPRVQFSAVRTRVDKWQPACFAWPEWSSWHQDWSTSNLHGNTLRLVTWSREKRWSPSPWEALGGREFAVQNRVLKETDSYKKEAGQREESQTFQTSPAWRWKTRECP